MKWLSHPTRFLFFTGKGGVGKTSISTATAITLADAGKRVLLVSTDAASNLDEMLNSRGAATAATIALRDLALESLGQARVEIAVAKGNEPSLGVARRAGAAYECLARNRLQLHGRAVDAHLFSFTLTAPA
jgi:nitrogenase subunit NifH